MKSRFLSRRELLLKSATLGSLTLAPSLTLDEALWAWQQSEKVPKKPTPWNEIGPFYKRGAPNRRQLRRPGDTGLPLMVSGTVFDTRGDALPEATVEIWQANHEGLYDIDGYAYRASLVADQDGKYDFGSSMPGHYPGRICQHIHYLVSAPEHKPLITQLYFATDPVFEGDPARNYARDPLIQNSELVRPVMLAGEPNDVHALVHFELVLERR
jgi:protocatechuate 3,4-dioxygenase beta subunit